MDGGEKRDWGRFFHKIYGEAQAFTEELLKDNEALRGRLALLESQAAEAGRRPSGAPGDPDPDVATLCRERDRLTRELADLRSRLETVSQENAEHADKYAEIDKQNSALASLYVASYQLHSTLDVDLLLRRVNEVIINLVGGERLATFLWDAPASEFVLADGEGVEQDKGRKIPLGDNFLSRIAEAGQIYVGADPTADGDDESPVAALPLVASDELVGVIVIYKLLSHKERFETIDFELFELLALHAASALMSAQLYTRSQRKANTLQGFVDLLKGVAQEGAAGKAS